MEDTATGLPQPTPGGLGETLLERDGELARVDALLAATSERGAAVLVSGEAGTGKSTLLDEVRRRAHGVLTVRVGRCDALSTPAPLGPLHDMKKSLPHEVTGPLDEGRRDVLFAALVDELRRQRNLFVIDDLHWADEATVDLVRYLGRRISDTRALLVCAFRPGEVGRKHPLQPLLGELAPTAVRLELRSLTMKSVAKLVAGRPIDPFSLYATTGGNPFFVTQMLLDPGNDLPVSIEDAVLARTRPLAETAWDVLDLVAIAPEGLPLDVLAELGPVAEADADDACRLGLLASEAGRLRARHELIRRTFESSLAPARRRRLHARLLDVLAARTETPASVAALAHHAAAAGDAARTVKYALAAAPRAARDGAHREAAAHYRNAVRHRDLMDPSTLLASLEGLAYESYVLGDIDAAIEATDAFVDAATSPPDVGRGLRFSSRLAWFKGQREAALRLGRRAVEVLEDATGDAHQLAYAYSNLAQLAMLDNDVAEAQAWGERAVALARHHDDAEVLAHALNNMGTASLSKGQGQELVTESLAIALEHGLDEHAARAYTNLAYHAVRNRDLDEATRLLDDGLTYTEARDLETWWTYMLGTRSERHLLVGAWERAAADAGQVLSIAHGPLMRHQATMVGTRLAIRRGQADDDAVARAVEAARAIGEYVRVVDACSVALEYRWHTGRQLWDPDEVAAVVGQGQERADVWGLATIGFWLQVLGEPAPRPWADPIRAATAGGPAAAAAGWSRHGCVFESALAAAIGDDAGARRSAFAVLRDLGADGTLAGLRRHLTGKGVQDVPRGPNRATRTNPAGLTPRQQQVLGLLAQGATNTDIAESLVISPKTVEHHVSAVLAKVGAANRLEAAAAARDRGLL